MSGPKTNPSKDLQGFLEKLGEPLDANRAKRTTDRVLESLRSQYRAPGPSLVEFPAQAAAEHGRSWFAAAAAAVVLIASALLLQVISFQSDTAIAEAVDGELQTLSGGTSTPARTSKIQPGQVLRTAENGGAVLWLRDGSRIELSRSVELSIHPTSDGTELRLVGGSVIVSAAKQVNRHLYVTTQDCTVSVLGTVFSVSAGTTGSRVSVIEGEVKVNMGDETRVLFPGEQMATNASVELVPVPAELRWSRNVVAHLALLGQTTPAVSTVSQGQDSKGLVRGVVRRASTDDGIPDVSVTLCQASDLPATAGQVAGLPPRENVGEIRISNYVFGPGGAAPAPATFEIRDRLGNLFITNPQAVVCKNPIAATTDRSGRFEIRDVAAGEYIVRAQREGYFGPQRAGRWQASSAMSVVVPADRAVPEVSLLLVPGGTISGRVRGPNGQPLAEATVQAFEPAGFGADAALRVISGRQADDRGEYRLYNLPPGEFYVAASPAGTNRPDFGQQPQRTYYPSALEPAAATVVSLDIGQEVLRVDIDLRTANLVRLSGTIASSAGSMTSANLTVAERGIQASGTRAFRFGATQGQGAFMFGGMTAGTYDFVATGNCQSSTTSASPPASVASDLPSNERDLAAYLQTLATSRGVPARGCFGMATVDVRDRDVEGIRITLFPRVDVSGRVSLSGMPSRPGDIQARLEPEGPATLTLTPMERTMARTSVSANADGSFLISDVPQGRFRPEVRLSGQLQDAYVADIRQSGASVLATGFEVGAVAPAPLEVVLGSGGGTLSGIVRDAVQKPVSSAFVVLVPPAPRSQNRSLYPVTTADAAGRFTVRGIAPGEYRVFAWYQDPGPITFNPTALSRFERFGRTLNVAPGASIASLEINVVPDLFSK